MESVIELFGKLSLDVIEPGSDVWVFVTHINNPESFYVRLVDYSPYLEHVEDSKGPLNDFDLQLRAVVIYRSKILKKNIRGQIFCIHNNDNEIKCDMFAVDYGMTEKFISFKDLLKPKHDTFVPPLAMHCRLASCQPVGGVWAADSAEAMRYYCKEDERTRMIVQDKSFDCFTVELINSCPDDIATMLAYAGYSTFGFQGNAVNRLDSVKPVQRYYTHKKLKVDQAMQVRLQWGKVMETFYVADPVEYNQYLGDRNMLTSFMKKEQSLKPEELKAGVPVAVLADGIVQYERGLIVNVTVPQFRAQVQLVDWGNTIEVPIINLKPIPDSFLQKPVMALWCCLDKKALPDSRLRRFLYPGYQFNIKVHEVGDAFDKPHVVTITSI